ncbi:hypothetical protein ACIXN8_11725 [Bacteroides fragilis]
MNKALPYVTGDWVHYLNSDDFIMIIRRCIICHYF